jgi:hypothetical protein
LEAAYEPVKLFLLPEDPVDLLESPETVAHICHPLKREGGGPNWASAARMMWLGLSLSWSEPQRGHRCGIRASQVRQTLQSQGRAEA